MSASAADPTPHPIPLLLITPINSLSFVYQLDFYQSAQVCQSDPHRPAQTPHRPPQTPTDPHRPAQTCTDLHRPPETSTDPTDQHRPHRPAQTSHQLLGALGHQLTDSLESFSLSTHHQVQQQNTLSALSLLHRNESDEYERDLLSSSHTHTHTVVS